MRLDSLDIRRRAGSERARTASSAVHLCGFVVGRSNQLAQAACQTVAELPSKTYNPLFIHGGAGLGKTHLLRAVGHEIARRHPSLHLLYLSTERFTNELITAIRRDRMEEFRGRYRTIDVLLIDDIQFIAGKERTQGEFFHTFNDLYEMRKQIVALRGLRAQVDPRHRASAAFALRVGPRRGHPAARLRDAHRHRQEEGGVERVRLPDDVAQLIARRARANIREIEGALTRVLAFRSLVGRQLTLDVAQDVLSGSGARRISHHGQRCPGEGLGVFWRHPLGSPGQQPD